MIQLDRRRILKAGFGATSLFLPVPWAWVHAQSDGAVKLLKAPKVALVIGNGKYKDAPELKNPANDAKGVGEALKAAGFVVTTKLDTGREELIQAIRDYVNAMEKQKAVGLFYFAGHGVQLDWRNYMLPVDAVIDKIEDVAKASVDIARLMEGLTKAANPMNVIILDACRENPFGAAKQAAKGLSQMDAPMNTILAYATSPGNVASDGEGANGLYTENLLREMKQPEAKIEDVFKRVRLGVRRKTNGAQIPWESTSLEEDFWFLPPAQLKKLSDAEKDRLFKEEESIWDMARQAKDAKLLEDYLRRYPSGSFSELAQLQLDRALAKEGEKKVVVVNAAANPYTKGSVTANTAFKVGDSYTVREMDPYSKAARETQTFSIRQITDDEVIFDNGRVIDLLGNNVRFPDGRYVKGVQNYPLEFTVGKRWETRFILTFPNGHRSRSEFTIRIVGREMVTTPAGTFFAYKLEGRGFSQASDGTPNEHNNSAYFAPDKVRMPIIVQSIISIRGRTVRASRGELMSYKEG